MFSNYIGNVVPYKGQVYTKLKQKAEESGQLFRDPEFPPTEQSLFFTPGKSAGITWKRAKDIVQDPRLFVDGVSSRELIQGDLGNCWLVAACSTLATHRPCWQRVIPDHKEQDWDQKHAGIFHFRFWRFGVWTDVVVDDFLPTKRGRLVFCHAPARNEFWGALLEKAYAKLYGSYEALNGGELAEALEDFTGGVTETYDIVEEKLSDNDSKKEEFFDFLQTSMNNNALICSAIPAKNANEMEKQTPMGLIMGHAYAITSIRKVTIAGTGIFYLFNREKIPMIRLRNPWGGIEWKGAFSDNSPEWNKVVKSDREKIGLTFDDDGEFWMTFDDFVKHFVSIAICHTVNTSYLSLQKRWNEVSFHSEWTLPDRAGGCINNKKTFLNNPQILFDIGESEDDAMFHLIQKSNRNPGDERMTIGFTIMQVEDNRTFRTHIIQRVIVSSIFRNSRSIFLRHSFASGRYILIPCVFDVGVPGEFLLRMYTSSNSRARELDLEKPEKHPLHFLPWLNYPKVVTQIKVIKAKGLQRKNNQKINAYCVIKCGRKIVRTPISNKTTSPEWNTTALFYRRHPSKTPICVEVWNSNLAFDEFLGQQVYVAAADIKNELVELPLLTKNTKETETTSGRIMVLITTSRDLYSV